jgi:hypothetical protein
MKIIAVLAMLAISGIVFMGLIPPGSVGGAMTFALLFLIAAFAVGLYDAWSARRGVLGWIVSIMVALIGGLIGAAAGAFVFELAMPLVAKMGSLDGSLMQTGGPLLYLLINAQMLFTLFGAWFAVGLVNKWR